MDRDQQSSQSAPAEYAVLDAISEGVFTVDADLRITSFNRAAEIITGYNRTEAIGRPCREVLCSNGCDNNCTLRNSMSCGELVTNQRHVLRSRDGSTVPVSVSTNVLRDAQGACIGGVESFRDLRHEEALRRIGQEQQRATVIGESPAMRRLLEQLPTIAASAVTVLISGESGTGKEVIARALHDHSPRRGKPFIAINCAALPDSLLESELFGYVKGAFTDARTDKPGRFALANGGTLFLDEIGDVSAAKQVRLLRVLQERCYEPLGGTTSVPCDVRIIAASNRNLPEEVAAERFRRDLYYRLAVIPVHLPPLRERGDDVLLLAKYFIERIAAAEQLPAPVLSAEVSARLREGQWPGNVRELANALERAWVLGHGSIQLQHLPGSGLTGTYRKGSSTTAAASAHIPSARDQRLEHEAEMLMNALRNHGWNRLATAQALGIHKTTLHRQIRKLGLKPPRTGDGE